VQHAFFLASQWIAQILMCPRLRYLYWTLGLQKKMGKFVLIFMETLHALPSLDQSPTWLWLLKEAASSFFSTVAGSQPVTKISALDVVS
jgi:hypothetical protein